MSSADDWEQKHAVAQAMEPPSIPTELVLGAVEIHLNRCWPYSGGPTDEGAGWAAELDAPPIKGVWSCSHMHGTEEGAVACAQTAIRIIVERKENPANYDWEATDGR